MNWVLIGLLAPPLIGFLGSLAVPRKLPQNSRGLAIFQWRSRCSTMAAPRGP